MGYIGMYCRAQGGTWGNCRGVFGYVGVGCKREGKGFRDVGLRL